MADEPIYIVPTRTVSLVHRTMAAYLQSIGHNAPPLPAGAAPSKLAATAAAVQAAQKAAQKKAADQKAAEQKAAEEKAAEEQAQDQQKTWIEIVLLDGLGRPVSGEKYVVELPDGSKKEGTLDHKGKAKVSDLDEPGECKISFPELDCSWFEPASGPRLPPPRKAFQPAPPPPEKTWIELILL